MLVDKDKAPKWKHKSLIDITDEMTMSVFRPFDKYELELQL